MVRRDGDVVVAKVLDAAMVDRRDLDARLDATNALADLDPRVCRPLPVGRRLVTEVTLADGEQRYVVCFEFADGTALDPTDRVDAERMGRTLAQLHVSMRQLPPTRLPLVAALQAGLGRACVVMAERQGGSAPNCTGSWSKRSPGPPVSSSQPFAKPPQGRDSPTAAAALPGGPDRRRRPPGYRGAMPGSLRSSRSRWSALSWRSLGSVLSAGSAGSVLSAGSALSAASLASIGSAGSILSIGSSGSILSIGSSGSILSIGSAGASRRVGANGHPGPTTAVRALGTCLAIAGLCAAARGSARAGP